MMLRIKPLIVRPRDGSDSLCDITEELVAGRAVAFQFNRENLGQTVILSASGIRMGGELDGDMHIGTG